MSKTTLGGAVLVLVLGLSGLAEPPRAQQNTLPPHTPADGLPSMGMDLPPGQKEKQAKLQSEERQKQLVADTDKLLQLANELHTDVGKTDKNVLSVDVIKKAEEIEKLAHAVKVKMRG